MKEVAAFLNSQGGTLLIGVDDDGKALGLAADYVSSDKIKDKDGFERHLRTVVGRELGQAVAASLKVSFVGLGGEEIC
ncbi:AlbA family DNA-binding domain-containing protein [Deinococcus hopiensis]|uniref:AlbA family DNA-binding domain-containing protein n=1 Tax=Deinococcus hopiensis TaxID=309885 RepID=UPI0014828386|nr:ATP-binding protein [Deinococcus hopiensis]